VGEAAEGAGRCRGSAAGAGEVGCALG